MAAGSTWQGFEGDKQLLMKLQCSVMGNHKIAFIVEGPRMAFTIDCQEDAVFDSPCWQLQPEKVACPTGLVEGTGMTLLGADSWIASCSSGS